jgi:hypothetical protein
MWLYILPHSISRQVCSRVQIYHCSQITSCTALRRWKYDDAEQRISSKRNVLRCYQRFLAEISGSGVQYHVSVTSSDAHPVSWGGESEALNTSHSTARMLLLLLLSWRLRDTQIHPIISYRQFNAIQHCTVECSQLNFTAILSSSPQSFWVTEKYRLQHDLCQLRIER